MRRHLRSANVASADAGSRGALLFFGGKGGVGKTTCAAAEAVRAADAGERVLVVSTDPAHSLGDALEARLSWRPTRVARGLFACELDAERALAKWVARRRAAFRTIASRGTYLDDDEIDSILGSSLPGVDELVGLIELLRLARADEWDRVVVDTAPTGHTLRLLETPASLGRLASALDGMYAKHRYMNEALGRRRAPDAIDAVIEGIANEADELRALLVDRKRCAFAWVLLPEALAVAETRDGVAALEAMGVRVARVVVNRVAQASRSCAFCRARVAEERAAIADVRAAYGKRVGTLRAAEVEPRGLEALRSLGRKGEALARARGGEKRAAERRGAERSARAELGDARLFLFVGKGGVGKTTCSAAAAIAIARAHPSRRVLLVSTDPAHSLGDVLAVSARDAATAIPGAPKNLRVREVDAPARFAVARDDLRARVEELFDALGRRGRFDAVHDREVARDLVDLAPPGVDEIYGALAIADALSPPEGAASFDVVVADTAPTGHTLKLFALPDAALAWVRAILKLLLAYRRATGLGALARDLLTLAARLRRLRELLHDRRRTRVLAVTRAAALPRLETERMVKELARMHMPRAALLVNAVTPANACARCERARAAEARELPALRSITPREPVMLVAPATYPSPRRARALERWTREWTQS